MEHDLEEIERVVDLAADWKVKQWKLLSKYEIQVHHSKVTFFEQTFYKYSKIIKEKNNLVLKKASEDSFSLKYSLVLAGGFLFLSLVFNYIFEDKGKSEFFQYGAIFILVYFSLTASYREIVYWVKFSVISNLAEIFERDMLSFGLSWLFIKQAMKHDQVFDEDNEVEFEKLSEDQKKLLHLKSTWKKYCIFASVLRTFCQTDELLSPPREIDHGGGFFY